MGQGWAGRVRAVSRRGCVRRASCLLRVIVRAFERGFGREKGRGVGRRGGCGGVLRTFWWTSVLSSFNVPSEWTTLTTVFQSRTAGEPDKENRRKRKEEDGRVEGASSGCAGRIGRGRGGT